MISLEGLDNLTSINGSLDIEATDALINLEGLSNLTFVGESFTIDLNPALSSLDLDNLCSVGGDFRIIYNYDLCNNLGLDLKNQVETCPDGGFSSSADINIVMNKECSTP